MGDQKACLDVHALRAGGRRRRIRRRAPRPRSLLLIKLNSRGFPDNARGQIAAAAAQLAEAWSYFRAFACELDLPRRNGIVAAVGVEIATRKLEKLQEDWQRMVERAQRRREQKRWPRRIRRRPLYRKINGKRVRVYRPDEIEPVEPLEDNV